MPKITYPQVLKIICRNNRLFIPDVIENLILNCLSEELDVIKQAGSELMEIFRPRDRAITLNYDRPEVVDAYSLYYLRRNTLIPRITIRDIVLNHNLQSFPEKIRVLDLGSGTGAVTIGLLEMFLHSPFNTMDIYVDAVDVSVLSLGRLKEHLRTSVLSKFNVNTAVVDLNDIAKLDTFLASSDPYDFIFAANVFNELEHNQSCAVLHSLSSHLSKKAIIIIVNAQRDFIKELQPLLVEQANRDGLFVYYPCPSQVISDHECWFWREHDYDCKKIRNIKGQFILPSHRDQLVAHWLILCNQRLSIFDDFRSSYPYLQWGVFRIRGKDAQTSLCEICTDQGIEILERQQSSYKRGAIVGFSGKPPKIQQYVEL